MFWMYIYIYICMFDICVFVHCVLVMALITLIILITLMFRPYEKLIQEHRGHELTHLKSAIGYIYLTLRLITLITLISVVQEEILRAL